MKSIKDSEIPDRIWNLYLKKFKDKFLLKKNENGIWYIRCKYGQIQLFSLTRHLLVYVGDYRSKQHLNWFMKKIVNKKCTIWTEGDSDISIVFHEKLMDSMTDSINIIKKKKFQRITATYLLNA